MIKYTYFWIDFFTIIIPFIFSFHPKLNFYKTWKSLFPALFIVGLLFVIWDMYFTKLGVWGFNYQYLTGIKIGNLPIEEILFFICIPFSCVFTFYSIQLYFKNIISVKTESIITFILIVLLIVFGIIFWDKKYPATTFISFAILLGIVKYVLKVEWLGNFYVVWTILLIPFFIVNGILTGTGLENPVVWYNSDEIMGVRLFTIPVEDVFYGMELIILNLLIYFRLEKKS